MNGEREMNAYKTTWITFRPIEGRPVVTVHDQMKIKRYPRRMVESGVSELSLHFASEEKAYERLSAIRDLTKEYEFYIYTDKQFGMRKFGEPLETILTEKQKESRGVIC